MIRLERITLREIQLPLVEPFRTVRGETAVRRILLLELADTTGATMWSECVAQSEPGYSPETVDSCWAVIQDVVAPRVIGKELAAPGDAIAILRANTREIPMAVAAVEMGIWALFAMMAGESLARFLAGASQGSHALRTHVEAGVALGMHTSVEQLAERAVRAAAEGYRRIKLKVDPLTTRETLGAVRSALGSGFPLSADANGSFRMRDPEHLAVLRDLDRFGLVMIEQPLAPDDWGGHAELQRMTRTPICLDESLRKLDDVHRMLSLGPRHVVNLKPGRVGGLGESIAIHDWLLRVSGALWCGGMLECGIGRAYNVALASLPGFSDPGELSPSARYWVRDVVTPAWTMDPEGRVKVPLDRPGLGVDIDAGFIDDCTVRTAVVRAR